MILLPVSQSCLGRTAAVVAAWLVGTIAYGAAPVRARIAVHVKAQVRTAQPFLSVDDVAGVASSDENLARVAGRVFLGLAPEPKERRTIERSEIHDRLVSAGFSTDEIQLEGAPRVVVIGIPPTARSFPSTVRGTPTTGSRTSSSQRGSEDFLQSPLRTRHHGDVLKDSRVRIHKKYSVLAVEEIGVALESGNVGDTIRVKCLRTDKEESLRVIGPGLVGSGQRVTGREGRQRHARVSMP